MSSAPVFAAPAAQQPPLEKTPTAGGEILHEDTSTIPVTTKATPTTTTTTTTTTTRKTKIENQHTIKQ